MLGGVEECLDVLHVWHRVSNSLGERRSRTSASYYLEKSGTEDVPDASFDQSYGAPVERYLEHCVVTKLSKMLIGGEIESGYKVFIKVVSEDDSFDFVEPEKKRAKILN